MELNEMEKQLLYQTEGSEWYAVQHELAMAKDPDRRKAADSLIKKLNSLTDAGYQKFKGRQEQGEIRIEDHAKVAPGGHLHYGHSSDGGCT